MAETLGEPPAHLHEASGSSFPEWTVYPTAVGTYLLLNDAKQWEALVDQLTRGLDARGLNGSVTTPPPRRNIRSRTFDVFLEQTPRPAALLGFRIEPLVEDGDINVWGRPKYRWGVPNATTSAVLADTADWLARAGDVGVVGLHPGMPATHADVADVMSTMLASGQHNVASTFVSNAAVDPQRIRTAEFSSWGQATFTALEPEVDKLAAAAQLTRLLTAYATELDVGAIRLAHLTNPGWFDPGQSGRWRLDRHLWSTRVCDANGIQLLTSGHLDHARDLSNWLITEVATDRFLVQAKDLTPWLATHDKNAWQRYESPDPATVAQARADFGDMILTEEIAAANPLVMSARDAD